MSGVLLLVLAAVLGLLVHDLVTWLTGRTSPDRFTWCRFVASGGSFKETRR